MEEEIKKLYELRGGLMQLRTIFEKQNRVKFIEDLDQQILKINDKIKAMEQKQQS